MMRLHGLHLVQGRHVYPQAQVQSIQLLFAFVFLPWRTMRDFDPNPDWQAEGNVSIHVNVSGAGKSSGGTRKATSSKGFTKRGSTLGSEGMKPLPCR